MQNQVTFQSSLGSVSHPKRTDQAMGGYTSLAQVIKVHHKNNTADVRLIRTNNVIMGSKRNEGRFSCRILCNSGVFDPDNQISSGVVEPILPGQLVLVAFMEGLRHEPVIIGSMHYIDNINTILPSKYPLEPCDSDYDWREANKYLRVFPTQDYFRVDGKGCIELGLHDKSFLVYTDKPVSVDHDGTNHNDLSEKNKFTGETLSIPSTYKDADGHTASELNTPKSLLYVHKSECKDGKDTFTKVNIDKSGDLSILRDNNDNKLTYLTLDNQGQLTIQRQLDSAYIKESSAEFLRLEVNSKGELVIIRNSKKLGKTTITLNEADITLKSELLDKTQAEVSVSGSKGINMGLTTSDNAQTSVSITDTSQLLVTKQKTTGETANITINDEDMELKHYSQSKLIFKADGDVVLSAHKDLVLQGTNIYEN